MKKHIGLFICIFLLSGCEFEESIKDQTIDEIQVEMAKKFDVPISNVKVDVVDYDGWRFTTKRFLVSVEGDEKVYMYIGNDFNGYELLIYEE